MKISTTKKSYSFFFYMIYACWGLLLSQGCAEREDCVPYEGKVIAASCNGLVVKVNNKDVNSFVESGAGRVDNVVVVRIPKGYSQLADSAVKTDQTFYFDFRELRLEEENTCPQLVAEPSRKVFMTAFSFEQCNQ